MLPCGAVFIVFKRCVQVPFEDDAREHTVDVVLVRVVPAGRDALHVPLRIRPLLGERAGRPDVGGIGVVDLFHDGPQGFPLFALRESGRGLVVGGPVCAAELPLLHVLLPGRLPERPVVDGRLLVRCDRPRGHVIDHEAHALFVRDGVAVHGEELREMVALSLGVFRGPHALVALQLLVPAHLHVGRLAGGRMVEVAHQRSHGQKQEVGVGVSEAVVEEHLPFRHGKVLRIRKVDALVVRTGGEIELVPVHGHHRGGDHHLPRRQRPLREQPPPHPYLVRGRLPHLEPVVETRDGVVVRVEPVERVRPPVEGRVGALHRELLARDDVPRGAVHAAPRRLDGARRGVRGPVEVLVRLVELGAVVGERQVEILGGARGQGGDARIEEEDAALRPQREVHQVLAEPHVLPEGGQPRVVPVGDDHEGGHVHARSLRDVDAGEHAQPEAVFLAFLDGGLAHPQTARGRLAIVQGDAVRIVVAARFHDRGAVNDIQTEDCEGGQHDQRHGDRQDGCQDAEAPLFRGAGPRRKHDRVHTNTNIRRRK
mmetsp:Transcript_25300/g.50380  ORF Transcript_25300/g.50380 Transcript_25300/m.50380 type:complete len:540 (-) Transcript_25300:67-1686(-)